MELLTTQQVAEKLQLNQGTIENWRYQKPYSGPPFVKVGGAVRYPSDALQGWIAARGQDFERSAG